FLTLDLSPSLSGWSLSFVPWMGSLAIMGAALQLVGGVIVIAGLLLCIAWVGSQPKAKSAPGERSPKPALAPVRKCRFCDAPMEPDASFCPKCQRSQM
ncbi:MAG: hypothetical protein WCC94_03140, partial [Candidatus Bathyarchaeia archaeon]